MATTVWSGLSVGALYAIGGLLFSIPLVRTGVINFAQAFYVLLGCYVLTNMQTAHWNTVLEFCVLFVLGFALGGAQELLTVRPVRGRPETILVTTVGMGIAVEGFILAYWGSDPLSASFFGGDNPITLFGGILQPVDLWMIGTAVAGALILQAAVSQTRWGILGRASMTDAVAAMLRGVNIPRMRTLAFAGAAGLACAFAPIAAPKMGVAYTSALHLVVFSFAAAAIGGFGSFVGTAAGGFLIGLVEAFASRYLGVDWVSLLVFTLLCTVLIVRPTGLFGPRHIRLV